MNKIKNLFLLGLFIISLVATAAEPTQPAQPKSKTVDVNSTPQVILYESNNDKKIIQTLPPTARLVRIYQEGDWIKVGNSADGTVGWINKLQYLKTLEAFNQPNIQEVFISQAVDKDNKPQIKIVAYQNGKPLSEKEAQSLYDEMQKQQKLQSQYWQAINQNMLYRQQQMLINSFQDPLFTQTMPLPMPIMVIEKNVSDKKQ